MGIYCQINMLTPSDINFQSGETVAGVIKYAIHEPMEFERITTSLKGKGYLRISVRSNRTYRDDIYMAKETYVDIDKVVLDKKVTAPTGCHEIKFNFKIPQKIPSTLNYKHYFSRYAVKCKIKYYIRIKFERPGWFTLAKHFKKEINIVSQMTPQLFREPVIYGEKKKLMRLFSRRNATIIVKATIANSVIPVGGRISIALKINNDSNILIKRVLAKLVEIYSFEADGSDKVQDIQNVPETYLETGVVKCGMVETRALEMLVPVVRTSLQYSKLVSREYKVRITIELPIPHRNIHLNIPVQIGRLPDVCNNVGSHSIEAEHSVVFDNPPPSYWEAMGETIKNTKSNIDFEMWCKRHKYVKKIL